MCLIRVTKTWFACHAPFSDSPPLHSAHNLSKICLLVQLYIYTVCSPQRFGLNYPTCTHSLWQRVPVRVHLLSKWLWRFTDRDTFLQSRYDSFPSLTQFQQTCFHPWSRRLKLPSSLLLPGADEKLPLDQKRWITLKIQLYMAHIVRC